MNVAWYKTLAWNAIILAFLPVFLIAALLPSSRRKTLIWGDEPGIGNKYWSGAMKQAGHDSVTLMTDIYSINTRADFDRFYVDFAPAFLPKPLRWAVGCCVAFTWTLRRGSVVHTSFWGFSLGLSWFWRLEQFFFRLAGTKVVILGFGGDIYLYSTLHDASLRYGLLASYPKLARSEALTARRIEHWTRHADCILVGYMIDGIGRWDVTMHSMYMMDTTLWQPKQHYNDGDGLNGPVVRVLHAPNHRGFKGTEFIIAAIEQLRGEGLNVQLDLVEGIPNHEVRALMQQVDILVDQCIMTGFALNYMEAMSSGLPVCANMEGEFYTRVFRRYGALDECPILSVCPENLVDQLRILITNPALRRQLGAASRAFVDKYHSFEMAQYLFGSIYAKILDGKDIDLFNLFHPLTSEYNRRRPYVDHPLVDSRLPDGWNATQTR